MKGAEIVIVGTGSLASEVAYGLSQVATAPLRVGIVGRSPEKALQLAVIANARAGILGTPVNFEPLAIPRFDARAFARVLRGRKSKIIFQAASIQSPWEGNEEQNGWTRFMASAGFGMTLPLQMSLAAEISRAADDSQAFIINASYPDCVNVALQRLRLRATCGIGNSAIVESFCRADTKLKNEDIRVVGHHGHLSAWLKGKRSGHQPRIWVNGREIDSLRLRPKLGPMGKQLNSVTASTAVSVMMALPSGETLRVSIPGVRKRPGGYPYIVKKGKFTLQLPAAISTEEVIAHNKTGERCDGLEIGSSVRFVGKARHALASVGFEYAEGFDFAEWTNARDKMLALRERLRLLRDWPE
jgi:hypothetical protein